MSTVIVESAFETREILVTVEQSYSTCETNYLIKKTIKAGFETGVQEGWLHIDFPALEPFDDDSYLAEADGFNGALNKVECWVDNETETGFDIFVPENVELVKWKAIKYNS